MLNFDFVTNRKCTAPTVGHLSYPEPDSIKLEYFLGCLTGATTNKLKRSFPTVQLMNFNGEAIVRCSLFQVDTLNFLQHSHSLVVRRDNDDIRDPHDVEVSPAKGYTAM